MENTNYPSIYQLTCPKCGKKDFKILGTKGAKAASVGMGMALGAIGNLIADSNNKKDMSLMPVQYKCTSCGNKFDSLPLVAQPDELLNMPCTIVFHRLSSFVGMAVAQHIYLNGVKVGTVDNGKEFTFPVYTRHNTIFVTDQYGVAFKGDYQFEAEDGGHVDIQYKRKFL